MKLRRFTSLLFASLLVFLFMAVAVAQNSTSGKQSVQSGKSDENQPQNQYQIDELVVTATKVETPAKEVGSSITVVTQQQIEEQQQAYVLDVLRSVPSLDVVQSGGMGGVTSVFIRGAQSEQTLVLIDGIEMNDPTTTGRSFDFANMTTDNIDRIEILRGPQSTLYGSNAIGGVINIITKTGEGKTKGFLSFEGGAYASFKESGGVNGGNKKISYSFGFSRQDTDGISAADSKYGNTEKDGYGNTTISGKLSLTPVSNLNIDVIYRRVDAKTDLDNSGGVGGDDPNYVADTTQNFLRTQAKFSLFSNRWEQKIGFSLTDQERDYSNDIDAAHPHDSLVSAYNGRMYKVDWQNDFKIHRTNVLTMGIDSQEETAESTYHSESAYGPYDSNFAEKNARTTGYYLQDQVKLFEAWFTTLGVRVDDHSRFGTEATYRIASAYVIDSIGTKFKASFGTGFKAPSLYQLYSSYGNQDLQPENSTGWDAGIEQSLMKEKLALDVAYFNNGFKNLVDFNSATYQYANIAKAKTQGLEVSASLHASELLILRGSYTYTDAEDKVTGLDLLRRAKNKVGFDVNYSIRNNGNINLGLTYVGKRADMDYSSYPSARVEMPGYVLANLAASYNLTRNFQVFGRINNLLNRSYEEVIGFGTPGVSAFGGIRIIF